ncbi:hypothetical protein V8F20_001079 [Naviculisporaceae sp. PSN 640]
MRDCQLLSRCLLGFMLFPSQCNAHLIMCTRGQKPATVRYGQRRHTPSPSHPQANGRASSIVFYIHGFLNTASSSHCRDLHEWTAAQ